MANRTKRKQNNKDLKKALFTRFMLIVAVFIIWIGGISVRLVHLQVKQHEWLKERAQDQRQDVKKTKMLRGTIFDRNKRVLAMSVRVKTLYADPAEIEDIAGTSKEVAKVIGGNASRIQAQLNEAKASGKRFVTLAKKLDEDAVQKVNKGLADPNLKKADLPRFAGLYWKEDQKRTYPYKSLAAQIVGFSNADDNGQAGIEQSQDSILQGAVIKKLQERDRLGRVYDETVFEREPPKNVVLTIDNSYQYMTEVALERGVKAANAKSGIAIVLNPKTGEILALANYPTFDPENVGGSDLSNQAIQSVYSPGSVFKLVTYSSALEKKLFRPDDQIDAGSGTIEVAGHKFTDSHRIGSVSYAQALAQSSNVCAIKTGLRVGKTDFYSLVQKLGFGSRTGVELPAETAGIVRSPERWNGDSLASMSIGYEIGVTALQMANAFATIANDGIKNKPHIIKEIRDPDENVISVAEPEQTQAVSAETARSLRTMLRQVVLTGTGRRAQLNGYTSAGKTGTAWKFDPKTKRVEASKYVSSFIGFAPADDPQVVIAVVMNEPRGGGRDGGQVSAPVFREIAEAILPEMGVKPDIAIKQESLIAEVIPEAAGDPGNIKVIESDKPEREGSPAKSSVPEAEKKPNGVEKNDKTRKNSFDKTAKLAEPVKETKNKSSTEKTKPKT